MHACREHFRLWTPPVRRYPALVYRRPHRQPAQVLEGGLAWTRRRQRRYRWYHMLKTSPTSANLTASHTHPGRHSCTFPPKHRAYTAGPSETPACTSPSHFRLLLAAHAEGHIPAPSTGCCLSACPLWPAGRLTPPARRPTAFSRRSGFIVHQQPGLRSSGAAPAGARFGGGEDQRESPLAAAAGVHAAMGRNTAVAFVLALCAISAAGAGTVSGELQRRDSWRHAWSCVRAEGCLGCCVTLDPDPVGRTSNRAPTLARAKPAPRQPPARARAYGHQHGAQDNHNKLNLHCHARVWQGHQRPPCGGGGRWRRQV